MPLQFINFNHPVNENVLIGDKVFYIPGGLNNLQNYALVSQTEIEQFGYDVQHGDLANAVFFGYVKEINILYSNFAYQNNIQVFYETGTTPPAVGDYIFFAQNNSAVQSDIKGYYASVKLKNNSKTKAELFVLSADIEESSK